MKHKISFRRETPTKSPKDGVEILFIQQVVPSLQQKGNIYLVDYKQLDGVTANVINGKQQYLTAPLVLFQKTPDDKLIPIAIQVI